MMKNIFVLFKKMFSKKKRVMVVALYFLILLIYYFFMFCNEWSLLLERVILVAIFAPVVYLGAYFILWIQIKNPMATTKMVIVLCKIMLGGFGVGAVLVTIDYFIYGFNVSAFIVPVICIAIMDIKTKCKDGR